MRLLKREERKIPAAPTDMCKFQHRVYVSTKSKRIFFMDRASLDAKDAAAARAKSVLFPAEVVALDTSGETLYCACRTGRLFGLNIHNKTVVRDGSCEGAQLSLCRYFPAKKSIFLLTSSKITEMSENTLIRNTHYVPDGRPTAMDVLSQGMLAVVQENCREIKFIEPGAKEPQPVAVETGYPECVLFIGASRLLVGTSEGKIFLYRRNRQNFNFKAELDCGSAIQSMLQYNDDTLVVGTAASKLLVIRMDGDSLARASEQAAGGIPVKLLRDGECVLAAVSREQRLGKWSRARDGRNAVVLFDVVGNEI